MLLRDRSPGMRCAPPGRDRHVIPLLALPDCLADISIIPSAERCDLPLQGGFRDDRRLIPLAIARLGGFLVVEDQQRRAGQQGAGQRRLCPISLRRSCGLTGAAARSAATSPPWAAAARTYGQQPRVNSSWHGPAVGAQGAQPAGSCPASRSGSSRSAAFGPHVLRAYGWTGTTSPRIGSTIRQAASTVSCRAKNTRSPSSAAPISRS